MTKPQEYKNCICLFLSFDRIEQHQTASDEQTRVLRWFTAPTLKVALGIAGLAKHAINKLVQAASADPNTEFLSQKYIKAGTKRGSEITKVRRFESGNIWSYRTYKTYNDDSFPNNSWHVWHQWRSPTVAPKCGKLCILGPLRHIFKNTCFSCSESWRMASVLFSW